MLLPTSVSAFITEKESHIEFYEPPRVDSRSWGIDAINRIGLWLRIALTGIGHSRKEVCMLVTTFLLRQAVDIVSCADNHCLDSIEKHETSDRNGPWSKFTCRSS